MLPEGVVSDKTPGGEGRKNILGGSDLADVLSVSEPETYKYSCIRKLWYEKNGVPANFPWKQTGPMIRGKLFEKIVAEIFQKDSGCRFVRDRPKASELWPGQPRPKWWHPRPDRVFVLPGDEETLRILEAKTMSRQVFYDYLENGLPFAYQMQPQYYLGGTGLEYASLASIWPDGVDYMAEDLVRDEEMLRLMYEVGQWFMTDVISSSTPPERLALTEKRCGDCPWRLSCLGKGYFEEHVLKEVALDDDEELYRLLTALEEAKSQAKEAAKEKDSIAKEIESYLTARYDGEPEIIHCREIELKWKRGYGSRLDKQAAMSESRLVAEVLQRHTKVYPKRTLSCRITKKSRAGWEARSGK